MKLGGFLPKIKWPSKNQWGQILTVFSKKEKTFLFIFLLLFLGSAISLASVVYYKNTKSGPAVGGTYVEGMVGSPRFINPIYAASNDVDSALTEVIYSGLMKYDSNGKVVPDLASKVDVEDNGATYLVTLRKDAYWQDGKPVTADDVVFTIDTIQDPDYKSPLRANYIGVQVQKVSDYQVKFTLQDSYAGFMDRLTFKILPKHIWGNISPQNFLLTNYNLRPIGSGPYQFEGIKQNSSGAITQIDLTRFKNYYSDTNPKQPYISKLSFRFFNNEDDLIKAARGGGLDGFQMPAPQYGSTINVNGYNEVSLSMPRYFAVFFNMSSSQLLANQDVRQALNYATDKNAIIKDVFDGRAKPVDSPLLPEVYGLTPPSNYYTLDQKTAKSLLTSAGLTQENGLWYKVTPGVQANFTSRLELGSQGSQVTALQTCLSKDPDVYPNGAITGYFGSQTEAAVVKFQEKYASAILTPAGLTKGTGTVSTNTRKELNQICGQPAQKAQVKFTLTTLDDPTLEAVAKEIQSQWAQIGVDINIQTASSSDLQQNIIKNRSYQMLLFGEAMTATEDPFPYWDSTQIQDPGLNLSEYQNSTVDNILETARTIMDQSSRNQQYERLQDILIEQAPAVFLYNPEYVYMMKKDVKGMDAKIIFGPSQRFDNIENWYINTKRTWK